MRDPFPEKQSIQRTSVVTTEAAREIFGQTDKSAPLQTWEQVASKANYSASGMAKICGVSLRTLQRHFRAHHGLSMREWLKELQMATGMEDVHAGAPLRKATREPRVIQLPYFSREPHRQKVA
jgi:AraC-like DNA-binding protein